MDKLSLTKQINKTIAERNKNYPFVGGKTRFRIVKSGEKKGTVRARISKASTSMVAMTIFNVGGISPDNTFVDGKTAKIYHGSFKGIPLRLTYYDGYGYIQKD